MNPIMGKIDQTGAVEAEDVLVNALRIVKETPTRMLNNLKSFKIPPKSEKTPSEPEKAYDLGYSEGFNQGKHDGYEECIKAFEVMLKTLNV